MSEREVRFEQRRRWVIDCIERDAQGQYISPGEHHKLGLLVRKGYVGMDGFKYCWPEIAKDNWRRCHP